MKKITYVPYILATIRAFAFVPLILSTFNVVSFSIISQIVLSIIVVVSDKFDGEISRKNNDEKNKLIFRMVDTTIDKTGIVLCLIGLLFTKKVSISYVVTLLIYNSVLLGTGAINLLTTKNKKESTIQGLFISRLFTAITGLSFLLFNNFQITNVFQNVITWIMGMLGISSLTRHLFDKVSQNNIDSHDTKNETLKNLEEKEENYDDYEMSKIDSNQYYDSYTESNSLQANKRKKFLIQYKQLIINQNVNSNDEFQNNESQMVADSMDNDNVKKKIKSIKR